MYTNATSLANKLPELASVAVLHDIYILLVCETWFNEISCSAIDGFVAYRSDRPDRLDYTVTQSQD